MTSKPKRVDCRNCGATNIGIQTHCLICNTLLPIGEMHSSREASRAGVPSELPESKASAAHNRPPDLPEGRGSKTSSKPNNLPR